MSLPTFAAQRFAWSHPPVDGVGYVPASELLGLSDRRLRRIIEQSEQERYGTWRNEGNRWRDVLGLDTTMGMRVLDYGCGTGIEALQYARTGNLVSIADISSENLQLAERVLHLFGHGALTYVIGEEAPFADVPLESQDIIHCSGVLHHIPYPEPVVEMMARWLVPDGYLRLMVYSDRSWQKTLRGKPPRDVFEKEAFRKFAAKMDGVGEFADWYDRGRLHERFGKWFTIERCEYLDHTYYYLGAVLRRR